MFTAAYFDWGLTLMDWGKPDLAASQFEQVTQIDPRTGRPITNGPWRWSKWASRKRPRKSSEGRALESGDPETRGAAAAEIYKIQKRLKK